MQITFNYYGRMLSVEFVKTRFTHNGKMIITAVCGETPFCLLTSDLGKANKEYLGTIISPNNCPKSLVNELVKRKLLGQISNTHYKFTSKFINEYCKDGKTVIYRDEEQMKGYSSDLTTYLELKQKIS